jgi:Spy/CpxP family protein refolding chaperone
MKRRFGRAVLHVAVLLVSAPLFAQAPGTRAQQNGQPTPRFAWWQDESYQRHLGLTSDQVTRLETIWQAALPELRKGRDDLDRQEAELSRLIETNADETVVTRQVDKLEATRAHVNKARTMLIWHHRQLLTPEQRVKLKVMRDRNRERAGAPATPNGQRP